MTDYDDTKSGNIEMMPIKYKKVKEIDVIGHWQNHKYKEEEECGICSMIDCPDGCELHYHHDGCPICDMDQGIEHKAIQKTNDWWINKLEESKYKVDKNSHGQEYLITLGQSKWKKVKEEAKKNG